MGSAAAVAIAPVAPADTPDWPALELELELAPAAAIAAACPARKETFGDVWRPKSPPPSWETNSLPDAVRSPTLLPSGLTTIPSAAIPPLDVQSNA